MSRPSDFIDNGFESPVSNPRLGGFEWLRWAWRQLTSMRTALLLLLALAVAAVPGSLIPQEAADPNGVVAWKAANPGLVDLVTAVQGFSVYTSVWFSAIYLLLFVSLIGCVLPRTKHHLQALRADPPRTPVRLNRLQAYRSATTHASTEAALAQAERLLKARRYRVRRYGDSVSAERGYLRETGNLVFHLALVGILIAVFLAGGLAYTGQRILAVGDSFNASQSGFDSLTTGRFFGSNSLPNYSLTLTSLSVKYDEQIGPSLGEPLDYTARVLATDATGTHQRTIKVNHPLEIQGASVYLLGNGYAPKITVRDATGKRVFQGAVPFIPQDADLTSLGVIKVPGITPKIGLQGFFYPTRVPSVVPGASVSNFPGLTNPVLSLNVFTGNLGDTDGSASNVYQLNTDHMTQVAGPPRSTVPALELTPGRTVALPNGLGTIRFDGVTRFASLDIHHDPTQNYVGGFAVLVVAGLLTSLLVPRRRMWVAVGPGDDGEGGLRLEYAALARGDDPGLERALAEFAEQHGTALETDEPSRPRVPAGV
ncbi:cytochrome c biogenesis protein ResB [uncultured Amnibacterium sp.]|uniref:cytochrome c biogenesis protein ResB n=1 Tax=uncultured Amnibacterium sp. TaxID=1631851 RepID=UPI0035CA9400